MENRLASEMKNTDKLHQMEDFARININSIMKLSVNFNIIYFRRIANSCERSLNDLS